MKSDETVYLRHILDAIARIGVPWEDIAGMRDKLIHDYFGVGIDKVWLTAVEDMPILKNNLERILADFSR